MFDKTLSFGKAEKAVGESSTLTRKKVIGCGGKVGRTPGPNIEISRKSKELRQRIGKWIGPKWKWKNDGK
jgi:hypothetical protein